MEPAGSLLCSQHPIADCLRQQGEKCARLTFTTCPTLQFCIHKTKRYESQRILNLSAFIHIRYSEMHCIIDNKTYFPHWII